MNQWEYAYQTIKPNESSKTNEILSLLGNDGWELVSVVCLETYEGVVLAYYFKRPKKVEEQA